MTTDAKHYTQDKIECTDLLIDVSESATVSNALDLRGKVLVALVMPSALTSTAITFTGSTDGTTYSSMTNSSGSAITCTVAASKHVILTPTDFYGARFLKLTMGSSEGADRTIIAVMRVI